MQRSCARVALHSHTVFAWAGTANSASASAASNGTRLISFPLSPRAPDYETREAKRTKLEVLRNEHDLAVGPALAEHLEGVPHLAERERLRDRKLELAGRDEPGQLGELLRGRTGMGA